MTPTTTTTMMKENPVSLSDHAKEQLERAKLFDDDSDFNGFLGVSALELIEIFERQGHDDDSGPRVADLFVRLARGDSLVSDASGNPDAVWADVLLGTNVQMSDSVRVKQDAYTVPRLADLHNGQLGVLVGARNGLCIVRYTNGEEFQHEAAKVEVLLEK